MSWNTIDSYGDAGVDGFMIESETPEETQSFYKRHEVGGQNNGKEISKNIKETNGFINIK